MKACRKFNPLARKTTGALSLMVGLVLWHAWTTPAVHGEPASAPSAAIARDIEQLAAGLTDVATTAHQREEAALRLVSRATPEARTILLNALTDVSNRPAQLAVARALASDAQPDPRFINPLFERLGADKALTEAAAVALANYKGNPEVLNRLAEFALARNQPESIRVAMVRAIGTMVEKDAAELLINLLTRDDEAESVRRAAAEALMELTGLREYGYDSAQWQRWWTFNRGKPAAQWATDLLNVRAARFDELQRRYAELTEELTGILSEQHRSAPPAQQADILLRYLRSPLPSIRRTGAKIVAEDFFNGVKTRDDVHERLVQLIGDSAADVRLQVIQTFGLMNDDRAIDPLLTQLSQEQDADVRAEIARALGPMNDPSLRSAPALLELLSDPSSRVAEAAARSLRDLAPRLRERQPDRAAEIAARLMRTLRARTTSGQGVSLRRALIDAMAPLRRGELLAEFIALLNPREQPEVRRAVLRAMGELRDRRAADVIAQALNDDDAQVRLEAVNALGKTATFEHAESLYRLLQPTVEPDEAVRIAAWNTLASLFDSAPREQLAGWPDRFRDAPERRLTVLKSLAGKYLKDKELDRLAFVRQSVGESLMQLGRPEEAAPYFKEALDHWRQRGQLMSVQALIAQRMDALLKAGKFDLVADEASELIAADPSQQEIIGAKLRDQAERLRDADDPASLRNALELIAQTAKMKTPLAGRYAQDLRDIERQVSARLRALSPPTAPATRVSPPSAPVPG